MGAIEMRTATRRQGVAERASLLLGCAAVLAGCQILFDIERRDASPLAAAGDAGTVTAGGAEDEGGGPAVTGGVAIAGGGEAGAGPAGGDGVGGAPPISGGGAAGAPLTDSGGTGGAATPDLRYCDVLPNDGLDWSCSAPGPGSGWGRSIELRGRFSNYDELLSLMACRVPGETSTCRDVFDTVTPTGAFAFVAAQEEHAVVSWRSGGTTGEATLWLGRSEVTGLDVGETFLLLPQTVVAIGALGGITVDPALGMVFAAIRDCRLELARGVRYAGRTSSTEGSSISGFSFAIHDVVPVDEPTSDAGFGGIVNLEPGFVTLLAYVEGGCIVAEASLLVEAGRVAYVSLVPSGASGDNFGPGAGGAAGAGGATADDDAGPVGAAASSGATGQSGGGGRATAGAGGGG